MNRVFAIALALLVIACTASPAPEPTDFGRLGPTASEDVGNAAARRGP